ncbi:NAD(P)/FAD-dependent oxidoreductase [Clostridiisalibacter paucivorans]|uniref:NAD(P)/FAD-dependent oxidoreductase n=1 Tax=Clostridiisalibacter paucivorans TaxID=408753 RepID=UPI0005541826|nr:NAD(P)/FAD-dependent oxidoreductase [Clostridiisalibacter paucivorans]
MKYYDVIIIGSGPAGLFTAINCDDSNRVIVLEKNNVAGKKLLLSGAGQCNITHEGNVEDFVKHYGEHGRFLKNALYRFNNNDLLDFFRKRKLEFISNDEGKVFPNTLKASDVLDILIKECNKRGVEINYNFCVTDISYNEEDKIFNVKSKGKKYKSSNLVIATGGNSYSYTGSTGDGYTLASKLGHRIEEPLPALTPLYIKDYPFGDLSGISFEDIPIYLWRNNKKIKETMGDILLTHKHISGPGILNFSRYVNPNDVIKINFIGQKNIEGFRKEFIKDIQSNGKLLIKTLLKNYSIPKRFIDEILKIIGIDEKITCANLNKKLRNRLVMMLTEYPMTVERLGEFNMAMVTKGGVSIREINTKTMESKIVDGLYFVGEVIDIDGDTGGYNIQAAFSTAFVAGNTI